MNQPAISEELKTAHTSTVVHRQPGCRLKLEMKISPEATRAAYQKAIRSVSKEISLPGFRKGKAPDALITKQFGSHVTREWHDAIANTAFQEFLQETKLFPFTRDKSVKRVEVKNASQEGGSEVVIEYEAGPQVPKVDKSQIKIEPFARRAVTEQDVEERIHSIQLHHADWSLVADRPIQEGDFVDLDIVAIDTHPPRTICEEMRFEVTKGKIGQWMQQLIVGQNSGATVEGMSERDETGPNEADFKPTQCRITIKAIYTCKLPEMDDALAAKVGLKTFEELKPLVEKDLNNRADAEVKDQHRAQVEEQLLSLYQFDIPTSMIAEQKRQMVAERLNHLQKAGNVTPVEELKREVDQDVNQELDRAYRLFFLCRNVAESQKIEVYQNEIQEEFGRQMMQMNLSKMGMDDIQSKLYVNVLSRKALDFLAS